MKMILWKELRENARWAALALLGLLLAEIAAMAVSKSSLTSYESITVCSDSFLLVTAFGCAAIGAALGALQFVPELHRDRWASLLHRPVARRVIFSGKAIAGLALYFVAAGLPLLVSLAFAAWPGVVPAPFVPGLARPAASDLLLGVACYFAALLPALHPGRWLGARGAIVLAAVAVLLVHLMGGPGWLPLPAAALFALAAAGAMHPEPAARGPLNRAALGLVLVLGLQTALGLVTALLTWLQPDAARGAGSYSESFEIAGDGAVFLNHWESESRWTLRDLNGKVVTDERYLAERDRGGFIYPIPLADLAETPAALLPARLPRSSLPYVDLVSGQYQEAEAWYLLRAPYRYFVGYDKLSSRRIGICDREGFKGPHAAPLPFPGEPLGDYSSGASPHLYVVGSRLYTFDFTERRMTAIFDEKGAAIAGAAMFPRLPWPHRIAVALPTGLRILDPDGSPRLALAYGHDPKLLPSLAIGATSDGAHTFVVYDSDLPGGPLPSYLDEIDAHGHVVRTVTAVNASFLAGRRSWAGRLARVLTPPIATVLPAHLRQTQAGRLLLMPDDLSDGELAAVAGLAAVLALLALRWARRGGVGAGATALWVLSAMAFGPSGLLAFRLTLPWAPRVRCPDCGRARPVRSETCPHCREPWPVLPDHGTAIFEPR